MKNIFSNILNSKRGTTTETAAVSAPPPPKPPTPAEQAEARIENAYNARFPSPPIPQDEEAAREVDAKVKVPEPPTDPFRRPPYVRIGIPNFSMEKLHRQVRKAAGVTSLLEKSERQQLEALDVKYRALTEDLMAVTDQAVSRAYKQQVAELSKGSYDGRPLTKEAMTDEFGLRRRGIKQARKAIIAQVAEITKGPMQRFEEKLRAYCESRDKRERQEAEDFGVEFHPSSELVVVVHFLLRLENYLGVGNASPSVALAHLS